MIKVMLLEKNIPVHLDVEEYIRKRGNGQVTFTVRMNNGTVVDLNRTDYVDTKAKYFGVGQYAEFQLSVKRVVKEESAVSHNVGDGNSGDAFRDNNF